MGVLDVGVHSHGGTHSGIEPVGHLHWGQHFCHFYNSGEDLAETLIPFFKEGIERNEACLWVASNPYPAARALADLRVAVPDIDARIASGQFKLFSHEQWYQNQQGRSSSDVLRGWIEGSEAAIAAGYMGLRLTGNTAWLSSDAWEKFMDYERTVTNAFRRQRIVALCSYSAPQCTADAVLDVVECHDFALSRRRGKWEVIESAATKEAKTELAALNADLERRVAAHTAELQAALDHQKTLVEEVNHRVNNTLATAQALVAQSMRKGTDPHEAKARVQGRIGALARAHQQLSVDRWQGSTLRALVDGQLEAYRGRYELRGEQSSVLRPKMAVALGMILHELAVNAAKYGALSTESGVVVLEADEVHGTLFLIWQESGGPPPVQPTQRGFGSQLIQLLAERDMGGNIEYEFDRAGLTARLRLPLTRALAH